MKKIIEMVMVLAIVASVNAAGHDSETSAKEGKGVHAHEKGHVCYKSLSFQASALEKQEKYNEAIEILEKAKANAEYKHHNEEIYPALYRLYNSTEQYEKNISLWNEGHEKGMIFEIDPSKEEFKPYLKMKGFKEAAKRDMNMKRSSEKTQLKHENCEDHETKKGSHENKETKKDHKEKR